MGEGDEHGLELRGRDVHAPLEHVPEVRAVPGRVAGRRLCKVCDGVRPRLGTGEEERQECADALDAAERGQALFDACRPALELLVDGRIPQAPEHRQPRGRRERVPGERPGLVDVADRSQVAHQLDRAADGADRKPAADDLPEHGQVRAHAESLLRAAARDPEAR